MTKRHRSYNTLPWLPSSTVSKNDSMLMEMTDWHILVDVFKNLKSTKFNQIIHVCIPYRFAVVFIPRYQFSLS